MKEKNEKHMAQQKLCRRSGGDWLTKNTRKSFTKGIKKDFRRRNPTGSFGYHDWECW